MPLRAPSPPDYTGKVDPHKLWKLCTANVTTYSSALDFMRASDFDAYLFQETLRQESSVRLACSQTNRLNRHAVMNAAVATSKGGTSSGVAASSPWRYGLRRLDFHADIALPPPERVLVCSWFGFANAGILLITVYCHTGLGSEDANRGLLWQVAALIRSLGGPYILGGDFNMTPTALSALGFVQSISGCIVAPPSATYRSAGASTTIDFFVVHEAIAEGAFAEVFETELVKKHSPVILSLPGASRERLVDVPVRPPRLPTQIPVGCSRFVPPMDPFDVDNFADVTEDQLASFTRKWIRQAVTEMQERLCIPDDAKHSCDKWGNDFRTTKVSAASLCSAHPLCGHEGSLWRTLSNRLGSLAFLKSDGWEFHARQVAVDIKSFVPAPGRDKPEKWHWWRRSIRDLVWAPLETIKQLEHDTHVLASQFEQEAAKQRHDSWCQRAAEMLASPGESEAHSFIKGPVCWSNACDTLLQLGCEPKGSPQDHLQARELEWHTIWGLDDDEPPLTPEVLHVSPHELDELVFPDPSETRKLAKKFKVRTSIGSDWLHPGNVALLQDATLLQLVQLWKMMLLAGVCPKRIVVIMFSLIPKKDGGERPVANMATIWRLFSKWIRHTVCRVWEQRNFRSFIFGAQARSVSMCAWRLSAITERVCHSEQLRSSRSNARHHESL